MTMKFTWEDAVSVATTAPTRYRPGMVGAICGMRVIDNKQTQESFGEPLGTNLYLVEFGDGSSMEIPERLLEKDQNR